MTRKDFESLAETVRKEIVPRLSGLQDARMIREELADWCATQNPRFDREKFLKACGVDVR